MHIKRIKETCLYVTDLERTKAFYAGVIGLPVLSLVKDRHVFFRAGDSVLLCFIAAATEQEITLPPHGAGGVIHFAFETSATAYTDAVKEIEGAGIVILHRHQWPNGRRSFYFSDPDGHLVEILEEGVWEA